MLAVKTLIACLPKHGTDKSVPYGFRRKTVVKFNTIPRRVSIYAYRLLLKSCEFTPGTDKSVPYGFRRKTVVKFNTIPRRVSIYAYRLLLKKL